MTIVQRIQHLSWRLGLVFVIIISSRHRGSAMIWTRQKGQKKEFSSTAFTRTRSVHTVHKMWPHSANAHRCSGNFRKQILHSRDWGRSSNNLRYGFDDWQMGQFCALFTHSWQIIWRHERQATRSPAVSFLQPRQIRGKRIQGPIDSLKKEKKSIRVLNTNEHVRNYLNCNIFTCNLLLTWLWSRKAASPRFLLYLIPILQGLEPAPSGLQYSTSHQIIGNMKNNDKILKLIRC